MPSLQWFTELTQRERRTLWIRALDDPASAACFKRAFEDAQAAGWLIVHDGNSVKLTFAGIRAARRFLANDEDVQLGVPALPAQPFMSPSSIQLGTGT